MKTCRAALPLSREAGDPRRGRPGPLLLASLLIGSLLSAPAAAQNLLTNAGLEGQDGFSLPAGSCIPDNTNWFWQYQCIPEIEPPTFWYPFWNSDPVPDSPEVNYRRPEFRVYGWPDGPHYAFEGQRYLVFFGFYGAIDAGIYQQVSVSPGSTYRFGFQGFAWSNCLAGKEGASGDGCDGFPQDQAVIKAGIDPTGGTDFRSANIVWSDPASIYDAYQPVSVDAMAASSTMTVFVRGTFRFNYQHNDIHVDALSLAEIAAPGPVLTLAPQQFDHTIWLGDPAPANDQFTVTNTGIDTLHYTVSEQEDEPIDWLAVAPAGGSSTGESDPFTVSYSAAGLVVGDHDATITVTPTGGGLSPETIPVRLTVRSVKPDIDGDGDVDLVDFGFFQRCLTGSGESQEDPACARALLDGDDDVDAADFGILQKCLSGEGVPAERDCAGI